MDLDIGRQCSGVSLALTNLEFYKNLVSGALFLPFFLSSFLLSFRA